MSNTDSVEVKPARSDALKKAQVKYRNKVNNNPDKKNKYLQKRRLNYKKKIEKNKENKENIEILKNDLELQKNKINSLESTQIELKKLKVIIDSLLN